MGNSKSTIKYPNMKNIFVSLTALLSIFEAGAQTNPAITSWLLNNNGAKGRHYNKGNSTPVQDNDSVNVQTVLYSTNWAYIRTKGVPAYITGPFMDGNPSLTTNQNAIFKMPLNPVQNTGNPVATTGGNIGIFINGVALFDYRDGVAWNPTTQALCGGPGNPPCPGGPGGAMDWNRDAIVAERAGFDCAKGHPAMGNYHHHQNPSAFKLDKKVISTVCNLYDADGLYAIDSTKHSPLIGFTYDGFPIYGAYAYKNSDGTGGIVRMKSGYRLRNITTRTTNAAGQTVATGPVVSTTYPLGYFREDYEFIAHPGEADYLDEHNGRFCITPEYPKGIYSYFATVDANWNSAYPYVVGPTFYGTKVASKVTSITEPVSVYTPQTGGVAEEALKNATIFTQNDGEFIAVQLPGLNLADVDVELYDMTGKKVSGGTINKGSTLVYLDTRRSYAGTYVVRLKSGSALQSSKIVLVK
jgi:hypothetical protein